jgi:hypothetical protein
MSRCAITVQLLCIIVQKSTEESPVSHPNCRNGRIRARSGPFYDPTSKKLPESMIDFRAYRLNNSLALFLAERMLVLKKRRPYAYTGASILRIKGQKHIIR